MKKSDHTLIENHMLSCMKDSAHDRDHIYRVLYLALEIAQTEKNVDRDMLICACLLHDIGRGEQFENPKLDHARVGAERASRFLLENHFPPNFVRKVCDCIRTHRYRAEDPPESLEAKILFDADKLDVTGAVGIARTLLYKGKVSEPLYSLWPDGTVSDGSDDDAPSFFQEYRYKLVHVYSRFFTQKALEIAKQRQQAAADFYERLYGEVSRAYEAGDFLLQNCVEEDSSPIPI